MGGWQSFKQRFLGRPCGEEELGLRSHAGPLGGNLELDSGPSHAGNLPQSIRGAARGALQLLEKRFVGMPSKHACAAHDRCLCMHLCSNPFKGIERYGLPVFQSIKHYLLQDLFTTLLNAPKGRFLLVFFAVYMSVVSAQTLYA